MNKFYGKSYESNFGNVSASDHPARFSGFIMTAEILSLLILGGAALFGLQGSLAMAMRHYLFRNQSRRSACDRPVSYTTSPSPRDRTRSRMPSSA